MLWFALAAAIVFCNTAVTTIAEPQGLGGAGRGYATYFEGFGIPYGGCGVPQAWTVDDDGKALPFVALNTFADTDIEHPTGLSKPGMFAGGKNCGRWLRMATCVDCKGGSNDQWTVCKKGDTQGLSNYEADSLTGKKMLYGYVADSCGDFNAWCRSDFYHVDVSQHYLQEYISAGMWGNRVVSWEFIDGPPEEFKFAKKLKFGWAEGAYLPYYPALIVHGTTAGVSMVWAKGVNGAWLAATQNAALGQMWILPRDAAFTQKVVTVKVADATGNSYGEFNVPFNCAATCDSPTLVP